MKINRLFIIGFGVLLLAGCKLGGYKVDVDLTPEKADEIQTEIESLKQAIKDYVPNETDGLIAWREIIELAKAYENLGELGEAIKVYEDVLADGYKTKSVLNNLGRLYEKTEQYDKAIAVYQQINDEYIDHGYLYDITWAYIRAGDRKNAEKYFNAWQLEFKKTDEQVQQAIKKLREQERSANK
jgi:tetratricopeptide (TPR) repeat protein